MPTPSERHAIVLTGLRDERAGVREAFVVAVAQAFGVPHEQIYGLLERMPLTVLKVPEAAQAEHVRRLLADAGGLVHVVDTMPEAPAPPPSAPAPAPIAEPRAAETPSPSPSAPKPAPPPAIAPRPIPVATTTCRECGASQPMTNKACSACRFPLGQAKAQPPSPRAERAAPARAPARRNEPGDGPGPSRVMRLTAGGLLSLSVVSSFVQMVVAGKFSVAPVCFLALLALCAWGVLQGAFWARLLVTIGGALGTIGCLLAPTALAGASSRASGDVGVLLKAMGPIFTAALIIIVLFVPMLWGKGSPLKAACLAVPIVLIDGWIGYTVAFGSLGRLAAKAQAPTEQVAELQEAVKALQAQHFRETIELAEPIIAKARESRQDEVLAQALIVCGVAYVGAGLEHKGEEMIAEAVALRPDDPQVKEFQAQYEAAKRQRDEAATQQLQSHWRPKAPPRR